MLVMNVSGLRALQRPGSRASPSNASLHFTQGCFTPNAPGKRLLHVVPEFMRLPRDLRVQNNLGSKIQGELLDFVTAGPKMRKWYGQESNQNLPRDGGGDEEEPQQQQPEDVGERDYVLVTDADTPTGELVVLQLILLRAKIRILVKDTAAAKTGYGPYVEPVSVDLSSAAGLSNAMKNVQTVIVLGKLGGLLAAAQKSGVQGLVLLSTAGMPQPGGLAGLFQDAADAVLKDAQREAAVASCSSIPHVIVKAGVIEDVPGGASRISVSPAALAAARGPTSSSGGKSSISREDLASAVVASAGYLSDRNSSSSSSTRGTGGAAASSLVFQVGGAGPGQPPEDWEQLLDSLVKPAVAR